MSEREVRVDGLRRLFRLPLSRERVRREVDDEIRFHIESRIEELVRQGWPEHVARDIAAREYGDLDASRRELAALDGRRLRRERRASWWEETARDTRFAARTLRRNPAYALLATLMLAMGIGANAAIFSVLDAALLRPLPFPAPDRLAAVSLRMPFREETVVDMVWSYPKYRMLVDETRLFERSALWIRETFAVGGADGAERVDGEAVTADYFAVLGIAPHRGRVPSADAGAGPEIMLSYGYWQRAFAADPAVIGRTVELNGRPFAISGVAPPGFEGLSARSRVFARLTDVRSAQGLEQPRAHQFRLVARLADGVSPVAARRALDELAVRMSERWPDPRGPWGIAAYPLDDVRLDGMVRRSVVLLAAAVALVLLIACVNLANLSLARGAARRREMAVRQAIGASRTRLVRQLLTESLLLAAIGSAAAVGVAWSGVRLLAVAAPAGAAAIATDGTDLTSVALSGIRLDASAMLVILVAAILAWVLFGLAPALHASRVGLTDALKTTVAPGPGLGGRLRMPSGRSLLVVAQLALAMVLLVASGLMLRSLGRLLDAPIGLARAGVLTAQVDLPRTGFDAESGWQRWTTILERAGAIPGVEEIGVGGCAPLSGDCEGTSVATEENPASEVSAGFHVASGGFFRALRVPLLAGRLPDARDVRDAPRVVVVNRTLARQLWPGSEAVGRRLLFGGQPREVIGVIEDARWESPYAPARADVFLPFAQQPRTRAIVTLRTAGDPAALAAALRRELRAANPLVTLHDVRTMDQRLGDAVSRSRFATLVLALFAAVALLLAMVGVYGVISLGVTRRTRELGIRMALGAQRGAVLGVVLGEGARLALVGLAIGAVASLGFTRLLGGLLYGVETVDPRVYAGIALLLGAVTVLACVVPARRATRIDPLVALRSD